MMKRWSMAIEKESLKFWSNPADGGWVKFTDHQAEIARRDELLKRAWHFMQQKTIKSEFDSNLYAALSAHFELAQKGKE